MKRIVLIASALAVMTSGTAFAATAKPVAKPAAAKPMKATKSAKASTVSTKFASWDANRDGYLSQAELSKSGLSAKSKAYEAKVFASADRNHDKRLSKAEFTRSVETRLNKVEG